MQKEQGWGYHSIWCQKRAQDYSDQRGNNKYLHPDPWGQKWIYASTTNWLRSEVSKTTIWEPFWSLVGKIYLWRKKIIKPDICIPLHRKINSKMHQKSKTIQLLGNKWGKKGSRHYCRQGCLVNKVMTISPVKAKTENVIMWTSEFSS